MQREELKNVPDLWLQEESLRRETRANSASPSMGEKRDPRQPGSPLVMRAGARQVLSERIQELQRQITDLECLSACLPMELSPGADEALYQLLQRSRNR